MAPSLDNVHSYHTKTVSMRGTTCCWTIHTVMTVTTSPHSNLHTLSTSCTLTANSLNVLTWNLRHSLLWLLYPLSAQCTHSTVIHSVNQHTDFFTPPPSFLDGGGGRGAGSPVQFQATWQNRTMWFKFKPHYKTEPGGSVSSHIIRQDYVVQFQATLQDRTMWFSFKPQDQAVQFQATLQNRTRPFSFKPHYRTGPGRSVSSHITEQDQAVQFQATLQNRTRPFSFKPHYRTGPGRSISSHITKQDQVVQFQATLQNRTRWFIFKPHYKIGPGSSF